MVKRQFYQRGSVLRIVVFALLILAGLSAAFMYSLRIPAVKGEVRCFIQKQFYPAYEPGPVADGTPVIPAQAETPPVLDKCDAADDAAIWVNEKDPKASLILGTNKQRGLNVYKLNGSLLASRNIGDVNNVDVRNVNVGTDVLSIIVGASHKGANRIEVFSLDPVTGELSDILIAPIDAKAEEETYGFCFYQSRRDTSLYAIATDKSGSIEQWKLSRVGNGKLAGEFVRKLRVKTQPEGCVADDANGVLYVGEEDVGIWMFGAEPGDPLQGKLIARTGYGAPNGGVLTADVEGLAIYAPPTADSSKGFLIASSQGNASYAVFDRVPPHNYRGAFQVEWQGRRTGDTDGLDVTAASLGSDYPQGVFVIQDGINASNDGSPVNQNFKFVSWANIETALNLMKINADED